MAEWGDYLRVTWAGDGTTPAAVGAAEAMGRDHSVPGTNSLVSPTMSSERRVPDVAVTENITVLFTDLVGSTELSSGLSPAAADQLRRGHFSALRQAIASSGGTEVKNLGDGLMVVFATASAALACAVRMQQLVDRDNRKASSHWASGWASAPGR